VCAVAVNMDEAFETWVNAGVNGKIGSEEAAGVAARAAGVAARVAVYPKLNLAKLAKQAMKY